MSFKLGQTLATYAINQAMKNRRFLLFIQTSLQRHFTCDWGDCCKTDKQVNDESLKMDMRILSVYNIPEALKDIDHNGNDKIWIITEADRSATTIIYPSEY